MHNNDSVMALGIGMEDRFPDFNMPRLVDRTRKSIAKATKTLMEAN